MADKKAYIDYKNNFLLSMLNESKGVTVTKEEEISNSYSSDEDEDSEGDEMSEEKVEK